MLATNNTPPALAADQAKAAPQTSAQQSRAAPSLSTSTPEERSKNFSPYSDRNYPTRVFWGDQHLHTSRSPDAGLVGDRLGPDDAYRFARGEQLRSSTGQMVRLERPYDWLVVSDHAEYLGLPQAFAEGDPDIMKTASGKKWAEDIKKGGQAGYDAFVQMTAQFADGKPSIPRDALTKLYRTIWDGTIESADRFNEPGKFTAFVGFEWTQSIKGNNLHRIVMFRDGAEKTKQVRPFSEFDGTDPESLWKYMADYEQKTGGRVLAIEHNPNLSCGQMFAPKTDSGKPFDPVYAAMRSLRSTGRDQPIEGRQRDDDATFARRHICRFRALEQSQHFWLDRYYSGNVSV